MFLLAVIVIVGYLIHVMSPAERVRAIGAARGMVETSWDAYWRWRSRPDAFRDALTARTRLPFVTVAVILINVVVFVSSQQRTLVEDADTFLRLRRDSWLLRARALHESSPATLRDADAIERASLDLLKHLRPAA